MSQTKETTGFRFYTLGIVAQDKTDDDGDMIIVTPIDELPLLLGRLNEIAFDYDASGTDHRGANVSSSVNGVGYVSAKWKSIEAGNRNTAPNVCEGETVVLLKYGSTDDVYWTDLGREPKLRRLENVIYTYSNMKDKGTPFDLETSHWVQMNARDQFIKIHTSVNREEKAGYDITFDLANGTFQLIDTLKNEIWLDSVNGDLRINTNRSIEFNTQQIRYNASEYMYSTSPDIQEKADTILNQITKSHTIKSDGTTDVQCSGARTIQAGSITETSSGAYDMTGGGVVTIKPALAVG